MRQLDFGLIDGLCTQLRQYADTIEKLIVSKRHLSREFAVNMPTVVAETRQQLMELIAAKSNTDLDENRVIVIRALMERYESLEGLLKQIRNDIFFRGKQHDAAERAGFSSSADMKEEKHNRN